jgi:hypothetical protein
MATTSGRGRPDASLPPRAEDEALLALRRRGTLLLAWLFAAGAAGFLVVLTGYGVIVMGFALEVAARLRGMLGLATPPPGAPDWLLIGVTASVPVAALVVTWLLWRGYRRAWQRRLEAVWGSLRPHRQHRRWRPLPERAGDGERRERLEYLAALLDSPGWAEQWKVMRAEPGLDLPSERSPASVPPADYERLAAATLAHLERDVMQRAIAVGLIISVSQHRLVDLLTIFVGTLEMQLHVLTRLGKQPSLAAWRLLLARCGASLFVNTYLSRQDAVWVTLAIKKAAMGFQAAGDIAGEAADAIDAGDLDLDEGLFSGLLGAAEQAAAFGLSVGSVGAHQLGRLIDAVGEELLQGVLAGGIMYYHGMALAADTLAVDRAHRASPAMTRTLAQFARTGAGTAGALLRSVVRQYRSILRMRRRQAVAQVARGRGVTSLVREVFRGPSPVPEHPDAGTR